MILITKLGLLGLVILAVFFVVRSSLRRAPEWKTGGIYSTSDGKGRFGVVKVLTQEAGIVHVRVYKQKFDTRPEKIEAGSLTLGSIRDPDGFGMGHLPLSLATFQGWQPVLLTVIPVTSEELGGYKYWKESGGGVF